MTRKYYVVKKGRKPGIYQTWPECQKQVSGYPNARYKSFTTLTAAETWFYDQEQKLPPKQNTVSNYSANVIRLYTDGGSRNHGNKLGQHVKSNDKAAWAYLICYEGQTYTDTAGEYGATNNKMEITALVQALTKLVMLGLQTKPIVATLDSHYVLDPLTKGWLVNWQRRGWMTASGKTVANQDLWKKLVKILPNFTDLHFEWTKGHAINAGNNRVDELLNQTMDHM
ncbi:viroplasmin family protein [Limosilactobacillus sp. STM2_1]|uniref:Ribonuclease H n=1 Tax=Limosilactobacillus rudii TaxID=2759755 RepID=A0A7W3UKH8_9LACO|nr:ribonuclease H family protein [Limosilactobacillus rudii]MBB1078609.1 viroplasmin family protein [Limosilactobacillus rudii]MBB1097249.1 viroplasmin family protein [Limosilactobacillus rudii]MCD7133835.1 ribonuclease H family protein [Limosilactobacillus rudii]